MNLFSPGLNQFTTRRVLLEKLLLDPDALPRGYSREVMDAEERMGHVGTPIGNFSIGGRTEPDNGNMIRRFLVSQGERTVVFWPRHTIPAVVEWVLRTHEVVE